MSQPPATLSCMSADTDKTYLCIDLKSFYASVECAARGLDPFTTNLVVADPQRTDKTICLAITPAMKALGISNRCRVFEIPKSLDYIMAKPRMRHYMEISAQIYSIYLRFVAPEDIHVYSIDECFIDATPYLQLYGLQARQFARMLMDEVFKETKITATAGIGTNLFLCKLALDIMAKHADDGIGFLDEAEFKRSISTHRPITDIWNIGPGIANRLLKYGVKDLAGVAALPQSVLYREFGVNAQFLIEHSHGIEPCTIAQIQAYEPQGSSMTNGQVLFCAYTFDEALIVLREMCDASVLELVEKRLVTSHVSIYVGYEVSKKEPRQDVAVYECGHGKRYVGAGARAEHGGGSKKIDARTNSFSKLWPYVEELYRKTVDPTRAIRRVNLSFSNLMDEDFATLDLFVDQEADAQERALAQAQIAIKGRFGKNAVFKATSLQDKATGRQRNAQVGGHSA